MNVYRQGDVSSHLITVFKDSQGKLTLYDPQSGKRYNDEFLKTLIYEYEANGRLFNNSPYIFRIDNTELNSDIFEKIAIPAL